MNYLYLIIPIGFFAWVIGTVVWVTHKEWKRGL